MGQADRVRGVVHKGNPNRAIAAGVRLRQPSPESAEGGAVEFAPRPKPPARPCATVQPNDVQLNSLTTERSVSRGTFEPRAMDSPHGSTLCQKYGKELAVPAVPVVMVAGDTHDIFHDVRETNCQSSRSRYPST